MKQNSILWKTTAGRIYVVLLCVILSQATHAAQAQEPETEHLIYLPIICTSPPSPYNVKAPDLVLQPSDLPPGYELDDEESGPIEPEEGSCAEDAVDTYLAAYANDELLFTGTSAVVNVATVFRTPRAAQDFFLCAKDAAASDPEFRRFISVSQMGDETIAYEMRSGDGFLAVTGYFFLIRKGNLTTYIGTAAFSYVADFDVTREFARKAYARLKNEIARLNTEKSKMSVDSLTEESRENSVQLEPVRELLESHVAGQYETLIRDMK